MVGESESVGMGGATQSRLIDHHRINNDPRMLPAVDLYSTYKEGAFLIYKTTRAGCTTALVSESVNRMETFTAIVPTNSIAKDTIIEKAKKYSDVKPKSIVKVCSNHECTKNKELIKQYPVLKTLPILPLADKCDECEYYNTCEVTKILREPNAEGFVLTYSKLVALMMASQNGIETRAQQILDIVDQSKNFIFDEVHELQYGRASSITVYKDNINKNKNINLDKYDTIGDDFKSLRQMIDVFDNILKDKQIKNSIKEVYDASLDPDYWKHHLRTTIFNSWKKDNMDSGKYAMACYNEIMQIAIKKDDYGLEIHDIKILYDMLNVVVGEKITIHAIREDGVTAVSMVSRNWVYLSAIGSFLMSVENKNKRIWLTSATICSYDYSNLFMKTTPTPVFYGGNGDPANSNEQMLIIADTKKYYNRGNRSKWNRQEEIVDKS